MNALLASESSIRCEMGGIGWERTRASERSLEGGSGGVNEP